GALCGLLAAGVASAADLKLKAPPPPPPAPAVDAVPMFGDFQLIDSDTNIRRGAFKIEENESPGRWTASISTTTITAASTPGAGRSTSSGKPLDLKRRFWTAMHRSACAFHFSRTSMPRTTSAT